MIHELDDFGTEYKTSDTGEAAYLNSIGYNVARIEIEYKRGIFVFTDVDPADTTKYLNGKARVEPCSFLANVKRLTRHIKSKVMEKNSD